MRQWVVDMSETFSETLYVRLCQIMFDNVRETSNEIDTFLRANESTVETTSGRNEVDFLSNGFKARASYGDFNGGSNHEFIYYAWAESPFVSSKGVPTTAF